MNIQEIAKVPFDVTVFNDGIAYNLATREITVADAGKLIFTASIGAEPVGTGFVITAFLYKNGLPIRQKASELVNNAPYATANISIVDKCAAGDVYELYATANATGVTTYAITSDNGVSGFEMAYL